MKRKVRSCQGTKTQQTFQKIVSTLIMRKVLIRKQVIKSNRTRNQKSSLPKALNVISVRRSIPGTQV